MTKLQSALGLGWDDTHHSDIGGNILSMCPRYVAVILPMKTMLQEGVAKLLNSGLNNTNDNDVLMMSDVLC